MAAQEVGAAKATLYIVGAVLELGGIILVGSPDLFPEAARLSGLMADRAQAVAGRLLRLLGLGPVPTHTVSSTLTMPFESEGPATVQVTPDASTEEKVAFLLERDQA